MFGLYNNKIDQKDIYLPDAKTNMAIITTALNDMFEKRSFDICVFNEIRNGYGLQRTRSDLRTKLGLLHCVDYKKMDENTYKFCIEATKELIKTARVVQFFDNEHPEFIPGDFALGNF